MKKELLQRKDTKEDLRRVRRELEEKFSLKIMDIQFLIHDDRERAHYEVNFFISEKMTINELRGSCEEIAEYLGGELYGDVNIDYSGNTPSVEMLSECL